jgi:hypothetical protein
LRIANKEGRRPMKILAALATALTLVGFGGAVYADCAGHMKPASETAQGKRILPPDGKNS